MKRKYEIAVLSKGGFARTVRIFAPKKADRAVIMHDGQNVFYDNDATFKKSWRVLDMLDAAHIKNTAVIGIDSTASRNYDYMPYPTELAEYGMPVSGGGADAYADYLEQIIVPYLDKRFGFCSYAMLGSSAGALFTLYFAARKNPRFSAYGLFSTPLFVSPSAFEKFLERPSFDKNAYYKIYAGGNEQTGELSDPALAEKESQMFVSDSYTVTDALRKSGVVELDLTVNNVGTHDELSWRAPAASFFAKFAAMQIGK